ncbi:MAG: hypothetical protein V3W43_14595, partial [Desulfatiglandaceae bacterium]
MTSKEDRSLGSRDAQEELVEEITPISRRDFLKAGVAGFAFLTGTVGMGDILKIVALAEAGQLPLSKGVVV